MTTELHTANLIHITPNAEALIAYLARISSKEQANPEYAKLLRYLIKHNHWSPFEMASMCIEIITTRAIAPQILRHRSFSYQELCLAGDAKIRIRGQKSDVPIAELYADWHAALELKCFDESIGDYAYANIKCVFMTGVKPIYEYEDRLGNILPCTEEHKVLTEQGFMPIEEAYKHNLKIGNANFMCPVFVALVAKRFRGNEQTYDIEMNHASHNYVANGFCVHNSQRYAKPNEAGAEPLPTLIQSAMETDWRLQDKKNRQNSIEPNEKKANELADFTYRFKELAEMSQELYDDMLEAGVAKECARGVLPLNQPTRLYMHGTIRSWIHYLQIRTDSATQKEHRLIAQAIKYHFAEQLPIIASVVFN